MLESMEGRRAMPRLRPPFPAQVGYLGRPTLINNVETLAHIPAILERRGLVGLARDARRRGDAAVVRLRRRRRARVLRGTERHHDARAGGGARGRIRGRGGRGRAGRRGERDPASAGVRHAAHARRAPRVRGGGRLGRGPGLPRLLFATPPPRRDDAVLRRGVVPEVHALPDREPGAPPSLRGARARRCR